MLSDTLDMLPISFVALRNTFAHVLRTSRYYGYRLDHLFIIMYVSPFHNYLLHLSMLLRDAQNPLFHHFQCLFHFHFVPL